MINNNEQLFVRAKKVIPGGVNSPVRAFGAVGGVPRFIKAGKGAKIQDSNEKWYLDYVGSWGPLILGHAHPEILQTLQETAANGLSFGAPTEREIELAETLCRLIPSLEMVRLVSSGTEATMSAIRLARGHTKRELLIKFEGCYHGHSDSLLIKAGSGALTFGNPSSAGVPADVASKTLVLAYNDKNALQDAFIKFGEQIAAVIIEPIAGNMNLVVPDQDYLSFLRQITEQHGSLLIFDEVMTGFRVSLGGVQEIYQIVPDLTTFGKIIGGGLPLAAFGGRADIMENLAPLGAVYQAGTLSGNPMAVAAGLKQLQLLQENGIYENLNLRTEQLCQGLEATAKKYGIKFCAHHVGSMFGIYFSDKPPTSYQQVIENCDKLAFNQFFHAMLERGIYFAPSAYEAGFVSTAHSKEDIAATIAAAEEYFKEL